MSLEEQETHILINKADMRDGYFRFSTTSAVDFKRLVNRIGGEAKLLELTVHGRMDDKTGDRVPTEWLAKVPSEFISLTTFGLRVKRRFTEEAKKKFAHNLKKAHEARNKK